MHLLPRQSIESCHVLLQSKVFYFHASYHDALTQILGTEHRWVALWTPTKDLDRITSQAQTTAATPSPMQRNLTLFILSRYDGRSCSSLSGLNRLPTLGSNRKTYSRLQTLILLPGVRHHDILNIHYLAFSATVKKLWHVFCCSPWTLGISGVSGPGRPLLKRWARR